MNKINMSIRTNTLICTFGLFSLLTSCSSQKTQKSTETLIDEVSHFPSSIDPEQEFRKTAPPTVKKTNPPTIPKAEQFVLPNKLTVIIIKNSALPITTVRLTIASGSRIDPIGKEGLSDLTASLLDEGTKNLDALAFQDALEDLGAQFSLSSDRMFVSAQIVGLHRELKSMTALLRDAIRAPRFQKEDFERVKKQKLSALQEQKNQPSGLLAFALPTGLYGMNHPYAHPSVGWSKSIESITLADVNNHHTEWYRPSEAALIFSGDIEKTEATELAKELFGHWQNGKKTPVRRRIPQVKPARQTEIAILNRPGLSQSLIAAARVFPGKEKMSEAPTQVLVDLLGGNFTSRLNLNLREKNGFTYGVSAQVSRRPVVSAFVATTSVRADVTGQSVKEILTELNGLKTNPPTQEEVSAARDSIVLGFPASFARNDSIASAWSSLFVEKEPIDAFERKIRAYQQVKTEEVKALANEHLADKGIFVLIIGDESMIISQLQSLGLPKPRVIALNPQI